MPSPWRHAFIEIEDPIRDLPRWVNMIRLIREAGDALGEDEQDEALTPALDQFYVSATGLPAMYQRLFEEAKGAAPAPVIEMFTPGVAVDLDLAASG